MSRSEVLADEAIPDDLLEAMGRAGSSLAGWAGGCLDMPALTKTERGDDERWAAHGMTDLGGWIGFGPTPVAAFDDLARKAQRS